MKVRAVIQMVEADGWAQVAQKGSHRQIQTPNKGWACYNPGKFGRRNETRYFDEHQTTGAVEVIGATMRYAVVIERAKRNYSAYIPDVPGCVATGKTVQQTLGSLREALEFHFEGMREDGEKIPDPETLVDYIDVGLQAIPIGSHLVKILPVDANRRKRASARKSA